MLAVYALSAVYLSLSVFTVAFTESTVADDAGNSREIPLKVIMELNQVTNVSELFIKFMPDTNMNDAQKLYTTIGFQNRNAYSTEIKTTLIPKAASCSIELQTICLKDTDDLSSYYYPMCTRVNRCGGCCGHDLLACRPTKIEILNFEVIVLQYKGSQESGKFEFKGLKSVSVDQHLNCKCDCIIEKENCTPLQIYNPNECGCMCTNEEDRHECHDEYGLKLWNSTACTCRSL
ncbi:platelet-derived growth factor D-like isoform X1 [Rhopalosiphum maidis]|uniref:platelet-derived growth factor D-like isoform X1 n=2 Tax=Rhopalosiphum maidis TaxID=43146 RepID=UPI000EFF1169|nr:platelet-derived growth factor D-like isoform X1 [Rhopalosiphum maidis]XP_026813774.1 platelet-derived growth factor D-like isoform X1 [Rhopalosiphum maidis]